MTESQGPLDKRVLLAAALSVIVLIGWSYLFPPPTPTRLPATTEPIDTRPAPLQTPAVSAEADPPPLEPPGGVALLESIGGTADETLLYESEIFAVEFSNRGAVVLNWGLQQYRDATGAPLQLFPSFTEENRPHVLAFETDDANLTRKLNEALFKVDREPLEDNAPGERIVFRWADGQRFEARKALTFLPGNYLVGIEAEVLDRGEPVTSRLVLGPGFAAMESAKGRSTYYYEGQMVWSAGAGETRMSRGDIAERPDGFSTRLRWVGLEDQYFAALIVPGTSPTRVAWQAVELNRTDHEANGTTAVAAQEPLLAVTIPESGAGLFVGPKKYTLLRDYGLGLENVVWFSSYGFLAWVSKGIFLALLWIHDHTIQNYGMAIVLSTFALRVLLFPVNQYSMVSMKKAQLQMQRLQPKVNAIRARHKKSKDAEGRAKMNQELMEMYKQEGVNPMGGLTGCLPLLAQFPILIGFYNMLTVAVELRGAPFVGWIQDLSREDPYWITPLLMGVTMFIQQKMAMNKVKDPQQLQQQRIMLIMPLIFMIFCVNMPSGLVLYWFVNNLLGIGQQWLVNRHTERLEIAAQKA